MHKCSQVFMGSSYLSRPYMIYDLWRRPLDTLHNSVPSSRFYHVSCPHSESASIVRRSFTKLLFGQQIVFERQTMDMRGTMFDTRWRPVNLCQDTSRFMVHQTPDHEGTHTEKSCTLKVETRCRPCTGVSSTLRSHAVQVLQPPIFAADVHSSNI